MGDFHETFLYHYTNEYAYRKILREKTLLKSSKNRDGTNHRYGEGVYLTSLPPETGCGKIKVNNLDGAADKQKHVDMTQECYFKFNKINLPGVKYVRTKGDRDVWCFPNDINLNEISFYHGYTDESEYETYQQNNSSTTYAKMYLPEGNNRTYETSTTEGWTRGRGRGRGATKETKIDKEDVTIISDSEEEFIPVAAVATPRQTARSSRGIRGARATAAANSPAASSQITQAFARQSQISTQPTQRAAPSTATGTPATTARSAKISFYHGYTEESEYETYQQNNSSTTYAEMYLPEGNNRTYETSTTEGWTSDLYDYEGRSLARTNRFSESASGSRYQPERSFGRSRGNDVYGSSQQQQEPETSGLGFIAGTAAVLAIGAAALGLFAASRPANRNN